MEVIKTMLREEENLLYISTSLRIVKATRKNHQFIIE